MKPVCIEYPTYKFNLEHQFYSRICYFAVVIYLAGFVASQLMRPLKPTLLVIVETEQTYDDKKKKVKTDPIQPAVQLEDHATVSEPDSATSDPKRKVQFTGGVS